MLSSSPEAATEPTIPVTIGSRISSCQTAPVSGHPGARKRVRSALHAARQRPCATYLETDPGPSEADRPQYRNVLMYVIKSSIKRETVQSAPSENICDVITDVIGGLLADYDFLCGPFM